MLLNVDIAGKECILRFTLSYYMFHDSSSRGIGGVKGGYVDCKGSRRKQQRHCYRVVPRG